MASWFRNLFEQRSFVASGKARQLHRAFGALYSPLAVTSKKTGYLTPIRSPSTSVALSRSYYRRGNRPAQRRATSTVLTRLGYTRPDPDDAACGRLHSN